MKDVATLYRLGKLVSASVDLDVTLQAIVEAVRELTGAASTAILLVADSGHLVIRAGRGPIADAIGERVAEADGLVGQALVEGRTRLVEDINGAALRARPDLDARTGVRSFIAAPLIRFGRN